MIFCPNCQSELLENARFCHHCGTKIVVSSGVAEPSLMVKTKKQPVPLRYSFQWEDTRNLPTQMREAFLTDLRYTLQEEGNGDKEGIAIEEFYRSGFREVLEGQTIALCQWADELMVLRGESALGDIDRRIAHSFHGLLNRFFVRYAPQLAPVVLPETVLRYDHVTAADVNLRQLILDYISVTQEPETIYTNAIDIPLKKLQHARQSYFMHERDEVPIAFADLSVFGSGKEGFVLTERTLYWKAHFHAPHFVAYRDIGELTYQADEIALNGFYFHVSARIDYKVYKLMQKLKLLIG